MTTLNHPSKNTAAFFLQAAIAFGVSLLGAMGGILFLPLDLGSGFSGHDGAVPRDEFVHARQGDPRSGGSHHDSVRLDEARMEKLLAEHNPFTTAP